MSGELLFGIGVLALIMALTVCLLANPIAKALGVMDLPDGENGRKRHARPTPLVGGAAIVLPVLVSTFLFQPGFNGFPWIVGLSIFFIFLIGFFDDRNHVQPIWRLVLSTFILSGALFQVPDLRLEILYFSFIESPFILSPLVAGGFTLVCLLGLQNAVNMADGNNGLVIGLSSLWTAFLLFAAPVELRPILVTLLVSLLVTLHFNVRGKLFLGDAGSYSLAVLIGMLSIYVFNHSRMELSADLVVLWFLIPVLDCMRLIVSRVSRGRAPFAPDRNHFHHVLYDSMAWRYGLPCYLALVALPGVAALIWPEWTLALIVLTCFSYGLIYVSLTRRQSLLGQPR
ncbi:undecaprenyl-phosphate alpha-N-acetylglucosaminyl 1-phosphate transferase [Iodidimonas gelatinilytica]|uniref:Undecaprenyl-phosphate alpha-N-acetylglucosaminyl 1-phosphate transferase n=1 Tax=Iodidimonas gelatinilytica TaxID=1236966 RepID=A0A5A7MUT3_9PROT|nr:MraY family glycosyltransferase [Iodidimonas gelatinilytica]GEQ98808.1 undecaprenyl-phosphate alpha-N-acetylglucosaminyl 1-phosphate transferase [Iodidimonas gelatinilytica]